MPYIFVIWVAFWLAMVVGWVLNIIALAGSQFETLTVLLVFRIIGVFVPPVGAVLGYFF